MGPLDSVRTFNASPVQKESSAYDTADRRAARLINHASLINEEKMVCPM